MTEKKKNKSSHKIHPLSFSEFLESRVNENVNLLLDEYMVYGGMPEVVAEKDMRKKSEILKDMVKRIYLKDISERNHLRSDAALGDVFDVVSSVIGSPVNPKKISDTLKTKGIPLSVSTVSKYISFFFDEFIFEKAVRYDIKGRKYIGGSCKYYCEDLGLRNATSNFRQIEYTHLMENLIYNELRIRRYDVDVGIVNERKTVDGQRALKQFEVDFVVNGWNEKYYIQSVYSVRDEMKKSKEIKPLECITDAFKRIVIVHDDIVSRADENGITYVRIIDFLTKNERLLP